MKNTEIKNIFFRNNGVSALYQGINLIWKKEEYKPIYIFSGKFTDDSTIEDWWFILKDSGNNANTFPLNVDNETKLFDDDLTDNFNEYKEMYNRLFESLFLKNSKLEAIYSIPVNTETTTMLEAFKDCSSLQSINCSDWNTENVTSMYAMFNGCSSLQSLDVEKWNTSKVKSMYSMFNGCNILQSLNCSNWNIENVTTVQSMFSNCYELKELIIDGWDFKNIINIKNFIYKCRELTNVIGKIKNIKTDIVLGNYSSTSTSNYGSKLTNESAMVFINGLSEDTEESQTITFHRETYDTLTEEQIALATSKGWSVVRS